MKQIVALEESEHSLRECLSQLLVAGASLHQDFEYATNWPDMDDDGLAHLEDWLVSRPQARLVVIDAWTNPRGKAPLTGEKVRIFNEEQYPLASESMG